jgi:hypothetical protein
MLTIDAFIDKILFLKNWFETELSEPEIQMLYRSLRDKLTEEELAIACQYIFETTPKKYKGYFPCVKDFMTAAHGDLNGKALAIWIQLLKSVRASKGYEYEGKCNDTIKNAIAAIGGIQVIVNTPDQDLKWLKKDFIEALLAFKALETRQSYLPGSINKSQLPPTDQD